jgi:hypothetical protein
MELFPDSLFPSDLFPSGMFPDTAVEPTGDKIILFSGQVYFPLDGLEAITPTSGEIVQFSYGAYIRLTHNFNAESGNVPYMSWKDSTGATGTIQGSFTDTTRTSFDVLIPDEVGIAKGACLMNAIITGTKSGVAFSVHSKPIEVLVYDGLVND